MRISLVYPVWQRIERQTHYVLPPLGVCVLAALTPPGHELRLLDENAGPVDLGAPTDLAAVSVMLVSQVPRALELVDEFRRRGVPVVVGGFSATILGGLFEGRADAVVHGEAEGIWPTVVEDASRGRLKPVYRREGLADPAEIPRARRDLLDGARYSWRGVRMMDLLETSRGCRFGCFPCQVPHVSGRVQRRRDVETVADEAAGLVSDRVFLVDSSLEQNEDHERALLKALAGAGKRWVSHPLSYDPDILELAAKAGWWYVYQAVYDVHDDLKTKVRMLHDRGIGILGTILLGTDKQGPEIFTRMIDSLLEAGVDLAEFTVLTPFPGTPFFNKMKESGRLIHEDWGRYNADNVVFKPLKMTPEQLEEGYRTCWERFYAAESQPARMARLYKMLPKPWDKGVAGPETRVIPGQKAGKGAVWGGRCPGETPPDQAGGGDGLG